MSDFNGIDVEEFWPNEIWFTIFDQFTVEYTCPILPKYHANEWRFAWIYPFLSLTSKHIKNVSQQYTHTKKLIRTHIPFSDFCSFMALQGSLSCVQYLTGQGYPLSARTMACAAFNGSVDVLKYLKDQKCPWDLRTTSMAALRGNLAALQYAQRHGCRWGPDTCANAATSSLECLKWAHENGCVWNGNTCMSAATAGRLDCLTYAHDRGCPWDEKTCISAAQYGHLACLKFAHKNGCQLQYIFYSVRAVDSLACLKYIFENITYDPRATVTPGANNGGVECLMYLHQRGVMMTTEDCVAAATGGHLEALKFSKEIKCPWSATVADSAATIDCVKYLLENGCPHTLAGLSENALRRGDLKMLMCALDHGGDWDAALCTKEVVVNNLDLLRCLFKRTGTCPFTNLQSTNYECLVFMHENGYQWSLGQTDLLAKTGQLKCLKYVHEHKAMWSKHTCEWAARGGYLHCLKYAHENGAPWDSAVFDAAKFHEEIQCLLYLQRNGLSASRKR